MIRTAGCLLAAFVFLTIAGSAPEAHAHRAPSGWQYPVSCCSGSDCYEIPASDLQEVMGAYKILATGQYFGFSKVRFSPDGRYHRCSYNGDRRATTFCLFVPQPNA